MATGMPSENAEFMLEADNIGVADIQKLSGNSIISIFCSDGFQNALYQDMHILELYHSLQPAQVEMSGARADNLQPDLL